MAIHAPAYAPWSGTPLGRVARIAAIAWNNVRLAFSDVWSILFLLMCVLMIGGLLFMFFFMTILPRQLPVEQFASDYVSNHVYRTYLCSGGPLFIYALLAAAAGSGLLSRDLRAGAIHLYLSRPITKLDYVAGKAAALILFLLCGTLVPGMLLWLGAAAVGNEEIGWGSRLLDLAGIVATSALVVLPMAAVVLAFSSLTRRTALAGVYWILFYLGTLTLAEVMQDVTDEKVYALLSWSHNLEAVGAAFFEERIKARSPAAVAGHGVLASVAILGGLTAAALGALWSRMRRFEEA